MILLFFPCDLPELSSRILLFHYLHGLTVKAPATTW